MTKEDYFKYYIQATDHYLIPKDVFDELFNEMENWKEEAKELKKQLRTSAIFNEEDIRLDQTKEVFETLANILNTESCSYRYLIYDLLGFKEENYIDLIAGMSITNAIVELEELENQQEEFIEYLTSYIDLLSNKPDLIEENQKDILEEILSKFKEIKGELK